MLQEKIEKNLGSDDDADSWIPVDVSFIKVELLNFDKNTLLRLKFHNHGWRRPLLGHFSFCEHLLATLLRHYAKWELTHGK